MNKEHTFAVVEPTVDGDTTVNFARETLPVVATPP